MKKLFIIPLLLLLGCNIERRQLDKLDEYAVKYPTEMQGLANRLYPCFSGKAKSDTVISTHTDTLTKDGVTTIVKVKDTVYVTKTVPIRTIKTLAIHDTVTNDRAISYLNTQVKVKADSLNKVSAKLEVISSENTHKLYWIIGLAFALLISWALTLYFKL
jgi:hypothetical protein